MTSGCLTGKTVLLTGATGLIGGAVLPRLLASETDRVLCVVRDKGDSDAMTRLKSRLTLAGAEEVRLSKREVIPGDLQQSGWALKDLDRDIIVDDVDVVVHSGASTYFQREEECRRTNEDAVSYLIDLAASAARRKRICYLGSAACGGLKQDRVLKEDEYPRDDDLHFVYYTQSKTNAENMLRNNEEHYDLTVVRPSYVLPEVSAPQKLVSDCL